MKTIYKLVIATVLGVSALIYFVYQNTLKEENQRKEDEQRRKAKDDAVKEEEPSKEKIVKTDEVKVEVEVKKKEEKEKPTVEDEQKPKTVSRRSSKIEIASLCDIKLELEKLESSKKESEPKNISPTDPVKETPKKEDIVQQAEDNECANMKNRHCRCRNNKKMEKLKDEELPKFDANLDPRVAVTNMLPVEFTKYEPSDLFKPQGDVAELNPKLFEQPITNEQDYLTPFMPMINTIYSAHQHASLINHLIENYDFFE